MGMFDWVNYKADCSCGRPLTGFQSKDGACNLAQLDPHEVKRFYTHCTCGLWHEWEVNAEVVEIVTSIDIKKVK